ncbi:MAG: alanine--glyoxylate aminotransferase family protein [Ignavibacteria bacterium]|nr:alanine--glyoxylate aminotransferase family protein [Ignavibacteria bacterium]
MGLQLFTPGPSIIPPAVLKAMYNQPLYHKSSEFKQLLKRIQVGLQSVFHTNEYVIPLSCSGTGAMEAAMMALHTPGDSVLVLNNGRFSTRCCAMLTTFGIEVKNVEISPSLSFTINDINLLNDLDKLSAIWITHCETSTGALHDIESLVKFFKNKTDALICVDGVSTIGTQECLMDKWGIDALITCSQKGLMTPPGLGFVALSLKARKVAERNTTPTYYFNLVRAYDSLMNNQTVFTPAVNLLMGLDVALQLIQNEGLGNVYKRHRQNATLMRNEMNTLGFEIFPKSPSDSLTVIKTKKANKIIAQLKNNHGIIVAEGQDLLHDQIIRIGHMGYYFEDTILEFLDAFKKVVKSI